MGLYWGNIGVILWLHPPLKPQTLNPETFEPKTLTLQLSSKAMLLLGARAMTEERHPELLRKAYVLGLRV